MSVNAAIATNVAWSSYACSLPNANLFTNSSSTNVSALDFGTARDNFSKGVIFGQGLDTHSRVGMPTGIELRRVFDVGEFAVGTTSTNPIWRGVLNPPAQYTNQFGNRVYEPKFLRGIGGKVTLDRLQYRVTSGLALLGNQSTLAGLGYSVSRVGIQAGTDGILFTPDDIILTNFESGTIEVDAIWFVGARVGVVVNNQGDLNLLNTEIGTNGTWVTFDYSFVAATNLTLHSITTDMLYPLGMIPMSAYRQTQFVGPNGVINSVVGPAGLAPMTLKSARSLTGPWSLVTATATEGTSSFLSFTGNPTNDVGFWWLQTNSVSATMIAGPAIAKVSTLSSAKLVSSPGSDLDLDIPAK